MAIAVVPIAHIVRTTGVCGGRPTIAGTRIEVAAVAYRYRRGDSVEEILKAWPHVTPGQVHAALSYYFDHQQEIDEGLALEQDEAYWIERYPPGKGLVPEMT